MNPNSISHRLFAAALSHDAQMAAKRNDRAAGKSVSKSPVAGPARVSPAAETTARKMSAWQWSGWQHTTI